MTVFTLLPTLPPINKREILRYAGVKESNGDIDALLEECLSEAKSFFPAVCYALVDKNDIKIPSRTLEKALEGCEKAVVFGATVGIQTDRLVARYSSLSPAKALMHQAIGTERVEALCDTFCQGFTNARPRVSPGYGDIPLELQRDIFALLNCPKNIGVTLNESLLMSPTKSVTAIFGVKNEDT